MNEPPSTASIRRIAFHHSEISRSRPPHSRPLEGAAQRFEFNLVAHQVSFVGPNLNLQFDIFVEAIRHV